MAEAVKEKEKLERKSSKSRLAKQDEVEELEEDNDNSPISDASSDATVIPAGKWLLCFSEYNAVLVPSETEIAAKGY